jgi:hypothetical protein
VSYQEWRKQVAATIVTFGPFWEIIDRNWTPAEQNALAREWKEGSVT